jgi:ATP phosphoribosyltransferase
MNMNNIDALRSAETILIPKGEDMQAAIDGLATVCGIEAPPYQEDRDLIVSEGRTFGYAKGIDIPVWVAQGWADAGVAGTDSCIEYTRQTAISWQEIGEPMCRYSVLITAGTTDSFDYRLTDAQWDGRASRAIAVPATRPQTLRASRGDLPLEPMDVPIRGSGELAVRLSRVGAGADLVKTGQTAEKAGLEEYVKLRDIYAALVVRS